MEDDNLDNIDSGPGGDALDPSGAQPQLPPLPEEQPTTPPPEDTSAQPTTPPPTDTSTETEDTTPTEQKSPIDEAQSELDKLTQEYEAQAKQIQDTITNIQNGSIPLSTGEQAQVDGLKQQFQTLIDQQKLTNTGAEGIANIRGYQAGSAEYDPNFQVKVIGSIITGGLNKIADLNTKMASSIATLTQSFKDNNIKAVKDAWEVYSDAEKERSDYLTKFIDNANKAMQDARDFAYKQQQDKLTRELEIRKMINNEASTSNSTEDPSTYTADYIIENNIASKKDLWKLALALGIPRSKNLSKNNEIDALFADPTLGSWVQAEFAAGRTIDQIISDSKL